MLNIDTMAVWKSNILLNCHSLGKLMEVKPYLLEFQVLQHGGPHLLDGKTVSLPKSFEQSCGYSLSFSIVHQGGVYRNAKILINKLSHCFSFGRVVGWRDRKKDEQCSKNHRLD